MALGKKVLCAYILWLMCYDPASPLEEFNAFFNEATDAANTSNSGTPRNIEPPLIVLSPPVSYEGKL